MKLEVDKFDPEDPNTQKLFEKHFNIKNFKKFQESTVPYLLVDDLGNILGLDAEEVDINILKRFLKGPQQIHNEDELFKLLDAKQKLNVHYFIIYNNLKSSADNKFTARTKLFRKFYNENGQYFEPQVCFLEITDNWTAQKLGISEEGVLHHYVNHSDYIKTEGTPIKLYNVNLVMNKNVENSDKGTH